jgi:hypothetical protein
MRCAKCGYFSFDYLSECKKCRTSLADVRRGFGFSGAAPAIPSLLAALFRDYEPVVNMEDGTAAIAMSDPLDFEERPAVALEPAEQESRRAAPPPVIAGNVEAEEDFSLLDLSDEELDLLMDKAAFGGGDIGSPIQARAVADDADFTLPESLSASERQVFKMGPEGAEAPPEAALGRFGLVLGPTDYQIEFKDEPFEASPSLAPDQLPPDLPELAEAPVISASEFEAFREPEEHASSNAEDEFVIELSEDDLDSLLADLSHPLPDNEMQMEEAKSMDGK